MSKRFIEVDRKTPVLFPPSVQELLPENHLARFVVEILEQLDLRRFTEAYAGVGKAAHHPEVLLGILIYGYATGVYTSRTIERACQDSLAFRFIAANTRPDHDTIATFRIRFDGEIKDVFTQVLTVAARMKLVKLGTISLGGSKVKAQELAALPACLGKAHTLLGDSGYFSADNVKACAEAHVIPLPPVGKGTTIVWKRSKTCRNPCQPMRMSTH